MLRRGFILSLRNGKFLNAPFCSAAIVEPYESHGFKKQVTFRMEVLNTLKEIVNDKSHITYNEWIQVKEDLKTVRGINAGNIDSIILQFLIKAQKLELGMEYIKQLKDNKVSLNIGTIGNLMQLYYNCGKDGLSEEQKSDIPKVYNNLLSKYKVLDYVTNSYFACAFLLTDNWKESLKILEKIKEVGKAPRHVYNSIIEAAFVHGDVDTGWNLLEEMFREDISASPKSYLSWLKYSLSSGGSDKKLIQLNLEKMFTFCGDKDVPMVVDVAMQYKEAFSNLLGWETKVVTIGANGSCQKCKSKLQLIDVTPDEFKLLQRTFYEKVLIGKNLFSKSTPQEMETFFSFLEEKGPFDIVLDGLNILYSVPHMQRSDILLHVVQHFVNLKKKVLILGRKHLLKNLKKNQVIYISSHVDTFLTEDLSYDDIFLLYASLYSDSTQFISRDIMRSHKFLLKYNDAKAVFKKWQRKNQISLQYVKEDGTVVFKQPVTYLGTAQKTIGWHIPYVAEDMPKLPETYDLPGNWICLQPPSL